MGKSSSNSRRTKPNKPINKPIKKPGHKATSTSNKLKASTKKQQKRSGIQSNLASFFGPKEGGVAPKLTNTQKKVDVAQTKVPFLQPPEWEGPEAIPCYEGRKKQLDKIQKFFTERAETDFIKKVVIKGLSGMGKTQLAVNYEKEHRSKYDEGEAIYFINAVSRDSLLSYFKSFGFPQECEEFSEEDLVKIIYEFMSSKHKKVLLIFDNAESYSGLNSFLPKSSFLRKSHTQFDVLITTVDDTSFMKSHNLEEIILHWNDSQLHEDLKTYLSSSVNSGGDNPCSKQGAERLVTKLGNLPLAVSQAAAYINVEDISVEMYLKRLEENESKYQELLSFLNAEENEGRNQKTVMDVWLIWLGKLDKKCEEVIYQCAFLDSDNIERNIFSQESASSQDDPILQLRKYSLINIQRDKKQFFQIHRLLQTVIRLFLERRSKEQPSIKQCILDQCIDQLEPYLVYKRDNKKKIRSVYYLVQHLEAIKGHLGDGVPSQKKPWARLLCEAGWYYLDHEDAVEKSYHLLECANNLLAEQEKWADLYLRFGLVTARKIPGKSDRKENYQKKAGERLEKTPTYINEKETTRKPPGQSDREENYQEKADDLLNKALKCINDNKEQGQGAIKKIEIELAQIKILLHSTEGFCKDHQKLEHVREKLKEIINQLKNEFQKSQSEEVSKEVKERLAQSYHYLGNASYFALKKAQDSESIKKEAIEHYQQALKYKLELYGKDSVEYIRTLKQKAFTFYVSKDYSNVLNDLDQCYSFSIEYYKPLILKETAKIIYKQAEILKVIERYSESREKYLEYIDIERTNPVYRLYLKTADKKVKKLDKLINQQELEKKRQELEKSIPPLSNYAGFSKSQPNISSTASPPPPPKRHKSNGDLPSNSAMSEQPHSTTNNYYYGPVSLKYKTHIEHAQAGGNLSIIGKKNSYKYQSQGESATENSKSFKQQSVMQNSEDNRRDSEDSSIIIEQSTATQLYETIAEDVIFEGMDTASRARMKRDDIEVREHAEKKGVSKKNRIHIKSQSAPTTRAVGRREINKGVKEKQDADNSSSKQEIARKFPKDSPIHRGAVQQSTKLQKRKRKHHKRTQSRHSSSGNGVTRP